jgi:hypothetical protein
MLVLSVWRSRLILIGPPQLRVVLAAPIRRLVLIGCPFAAPGSDWLLVQVVVSSAAGLDSFTASPSLVKMASSFMQSSTSGLGKHSSNFTHFLSKGTNIDWAFCVPLFSTVRYSTVQRYFTKCVQYGRLQVPYISMINAVFCCAWYLFLRCHRA